MDGNIKVCQVGVSSFVQEDVVGLEISVEAGMLEGKVGWEFFRIIPVHYIVVVKEGKCR